CDERAHQRAVDRHERTEFFRNRIPLGGGEEAKAKLGKRLPTAHEQRDDDAAENDQNQNRRPRRRSLKHAIQQALALQYVVRNLGAGAFHGWSSGFGEEAGSRPSSMG